MNVLDYNQPSYGELLNYQKSIKLVRGGEKKVDGGFMNFFQSRSSTMQILPLLPLTFPISSSLHQLNSFLYN
jgi:hypothetical protein